MKTAFTMLELIAVILIVAILSIIMIPRFSDSKLREAADQIMSHIRYTQHLAMMEDKYISNPSLSAEETNLKKTKNTKYWYKSYWEIMFHTSGAESPTYSIFSDSPTSGTTGSGVAAYDGNPRNADKVAIDPANQLKMCGLSHTTSSIPEDKIDTSLRLGKKYGITSLTVSNNCNSHRFLFDAIGRPFCSTPASSDGNKYYFNAANKLTSTAVITLCIDTECKKIFIEPETGYVHMD